MRDLVVGLALGHQRQNPLLLLGQHRESRGFLLARGLAHVGKDALGQGWIEQGLSLAHGLQGAQQILPAGLLEHVAGGAGADGGKQHVIFGIAGEHDDFGGR